MTIEHCQMIRATAASKIRYCHHLFFAVSRMLSLSVRISAFSGIRFFRKERRQYAIQIAMTEDKNSQYREMKGHSLYMNGRLMIWKRQRSVVKPERILAAIPFSALKSI